MGCDINSRVQVKTPDGWKTVTAPIFPSDNPELFENSGGIWNKPTVEPFSWRSYGMFAFLANVRNYSYIPPMSEPRGLPEDHPDLMSYNHPDSEDCPYGDHSFSWLSLKELAEFDYGMKFEDRRCMRDGSGAADAGIGNGVKVTFKEFLGPLFFRDLAIMQALRFPIECIRVVFGFDN